jgi:hypothetical protein
VWEGFFNNKTEIKANGKEYKNEKAYSIIGSYDIDYRALCE